MADPVIVCLSRSGEPVAHRIAEATGWAVHGREGRVDKADVFFADALEHGRSLFAAGVPVIGVCAAGILIRAVAPLLNDKRTEPAVVSVPDDGSTVVPLLGGHRGANRLARQVAQILESHAAVTTAGDVALGISLDEPPAGWRLANPEDAKSAMAALLSGAEATLICDKADWLAPLAERSGIKKASAPFDTPHHIDADGNKTATELAGQGYHAAIKIAGGPQLIYRAQHCVLGVGCARGCAPEELIALVTDSLQRAMIAPGDIAAVTSLDLKADEEAVNALALHLGVPVRFFDAATLEAQQHRLANPSDVVFAEVGCHGVSEGAALAGAGQDAKLLVEKQKTANATCAVACAPAPIVDIKGRKRGRVSLIGIGPGQAAWRTPEASRLVSEAEELIGYGLYIDLLGPLAYGKPRHDFPLGGEEDRCRFALEKAGEGKDVAIICSGDAGIYAMGALVFELLDRGDISDAARRVDVISAPGVSALQGAAARAGAPLGHDFCAISLSDLLTPREDIIRRIKAAAMGDFVIAFYNPVSKRRRTLLAEARDMLLEHRPADTPVLLASSLGRPEEKLVYRDLAALDVDEVDMLTVVLIGSSQSRVTAAGRMYTPRGYAKKMKAAE